jgi:non-specific serine/threonine protein kinase
MDVRLGDIVVDLSEGAILRGEDKVDTLTELEVRLLAYLVARPARDVSRDELHREVWGYAEGVRSRAVDFTMSRLRRKVEPDPSKPQFLHTVRGAGYRYAPAEGERPEPPPVAPPDLFVGRRAEMDRLRKLMSGGARLVTLLGLGGVGKTRLALEYLSTKPHHDAVVVDLSSVNSRAGLIEAVANALGVPSQVRDRTSGVAELLRTRSPLLVLDDIDQVAAVGSDLLRSWLAEGETQILATSRERLRVSGEHVLDLGPLEAPEAIELFRVRSEAVRGVLMADDESVLEAIAARLEGWPLAIELAAARTRAVSPEVLLDRLDPFGLQARRRDMPSRQQSVGAILEDTWNQLSEGERDALSAVVLLPHGACLDALETMLRWRDPVDVIADLADRALVVVEEIHGAARARPVGIVRRWVANNQTASSSLERRMMSWAAEEAERVTAHISGGYAWRDALDSELPTVQSIWEDRRGVSKTVVRLGISLIRWRSVRGPWLGLEESAAVVVREAVEHGDPLLVARARVLRANVLRLVGQFEEAVAMAQVATTERAEDSVAREATYVIGASLRRLGDLEGAQQHFESLLDRPDLQAGRAASVLALVHKAREEFEQGIQRARDAIRIVDGCSARAHVSSAALNLAVVFHDAGQLDEARAALHDAEAALPDSGNPVLRASILHSRATLEATAGNLEIAEQMIRTRLDLLRAFGDRTGSAWALSSLAMIHVERRRLTEAQALLEKALQAHRETGSRAGVAAAEANLGILALHRRTDNVAATHLRRGLAEAEAVGITSYVTIIRDFLALAEGRWEGREIGDGSQDDRLLARLVAERGL